MDHDASHVLDNLEIDWEAELLRDELVRVELPCTLADLAAVATAHGVSPQQVVVTSSAHVAGVDVLTLRVPRPERVAELVARHGREFSPCTGDECAECGFDLAHHLDGVRCP